MATIDFGGQIETKYNRSGQRWPLSSFLSSSQQFCSSWIRLQKLYLNKANNLMKKTHGGHHKLKTQKSSVQNYCSLLKPKIPQNRIPKERNTKGSSITINFHSSWGEETYLKVWPLLTSEDKLKPNTTEVARGGHLALFSAVLSSSVVAE